MGNLLKIQVQGGSLQRNSANCSNEEDIPHVQEVAKELTTFNTISIDVAKASQKKPQYSSEGVENGYGSVLIDNVKIYDKLSHAELIDLINLLSNCKKILYTPCSLLQTRDEERQKRKLLSLLGMLNWGIKDYTLQARLLKTMEDRLHTNIFLKKLNVSK